MPKIKKNIVDIKTSATLAINELSHKLEKKGKEIYSLTDNLIGICTGFKLFHRI